MKPTWRRTRAEQPRPRHRRRTTDRKAREATRRMRRELDEIAAARLREGPTSRYVRNLSADQPTPDQPHDQPFRGWTDPASYERILP